MRQKIMLAFYGLIIAMAVFSTHAGAVSLGKIDVASHLGEPFYAEVPLTLDEGEVISSVSVELAEPADYRILEVYRDRALQMIHAEVESDSRGSRVELTSRGAIDAPFFNVVLKVHYGRATHFKKYPVFLDLPRAAAPSKDVAPLPSVSVGEAAEPMVTPVEAMPVVAATSEDDATEEQPAPFTPHDQWARTSHYGPMVYGDTISTVADRLRIDDRYSRNRVMVALFEKNRSKFENDNINLIQAGTHLDVPMANEVERISSEQATSIMKDHNQRWRELVKQPRYAAVKEAQETRYSKRVRVGKSATGVAASPVLKSAADETLTTIEQPSTSPVAVDGEAGGMAADNMAAESEVTTALTASVASLQKENEELQAKLAETSASLAKFSAAGVADAQVAADARIKRLELQLARLHAELDSARQSEAAGPAFGWLTYALGGLVIVLLGGIAFLMRRERQHPATQATGEAGSPAGLDMPAEEAPEINVEPVNEPTGDAAEEMGVGEFDDAFTDSIPDLTEDETGEMEAFNEDQEEEPDPNVDYLSEADVYMRYGMEDEAEKQVELALKLRSSDEDAHAKLVQVRKAKGDDVGVDAALSTARMTLSGDSLTNFEATISGMAADIGANIEEGSLDDTLPPGALDVSDMESDTPFDEGASDQGESSEADDIDLDAEAGLDEEPAVAGEADDLEFDLSGLELPDEDVSEPAVEATEVATEEVPAEEAPVEESATEEAPESIESGGLDFDLSGLELPDSATSEPEAQADEVVEEKVEEAKEKPEFEATESVDEDDGLSLADFDLSDEMMQISEESEEDSVQVDALDELGTADLDKTVVMDWSKQTMASADQSVGGESGADEIDFSDTDSGVEDLIAEEPVVEEAQAESEPEEHLSSLDLSLEDLDLDTDVNPDESMDSDEPDDFSSTIQTSSAKIQAEVDSSLGESTDAQKGDEDDGLEFEFEPVDEEKKAGVSEGEISAEDLGNVSLNDLSGSGSLEDLLKESDSDFDATMELDSLLSDLDEPVADKKKDSDKEA